MKRNTFYIFVIIAIIYSCGAPKEVINYRELAATSYKTGDYQKAITELNQYLSEKELKGEEPNPVVYSDLAEANLGLENMSEAERYYDWATIKNAVSEDLVVKMSQYFSKIDNLSKEITALEYYRDHFPKAKDSTMMRIRTFNSYMESENWEQAQQSWNQLNENTKESEEFTQQYFSLNKELENKEQCDELAQKLLEFNPENIDAMEWMAKKYYDLGENRYQSAMNTYNKKKTTKNYKILLKELDQVTIDLKRSLKYFDKLWEMEDGKKYATYLANIHARFDDKKKSQYYKSFIK